MQFGNDKSRIIRGLAIVLMVTGHTLPRKIIPFAAPLFSFLVGYGYAYAKEKNLRHAGKRIWHLLSNFWFILFCICVPIAIFYTHYKFTGTQLLLNMFGLWPGFNYYCWYVNFYILAMIAMPGLSRLIDRYNLKALIPIIILFCGTYFLLEFHPGFESNKLTGTFDRFCKLMPIVVAAYWIARQQIYNQIRITPGGKTAIAAIGVIACAYLIRAIIPHNYLDFLLCPIFAGGVAILFDSVGIIGGWIAKVGGWCNAIITDLGMKSMHIWFLHSLFLAHSTKGLFSFLTPLYSNPVSKVTVILIASWLLAKLCIGILGSGVRLRSLMQKFA